jgi:hypothetical protein
MMPEVRRLDVANGEVSTERSRGFEAGSRGWSRRKRWVRSEARTIRT